MGIWPGDFPTPFSRPKFRGEEFTETATGRMDSVTTPNPERKTNKAGGLAKSARTLPTYPWGGESWVDEMNSEAFCAMVFRRRW